MKDRIVVGSRGSKLALLQAQDVVDQLKTANPRLHFELKAIKTAGDIDRKTSLQVQGGKGIFVKEIEEALLRYDIDIAVHSLKDMRPRSHPACVWRRSRSAWTRAMCSSRRAAFVCRSCRRVPESAPAASGALFSL